jgi:hypothetical protein
MVQENEVPKIGLILIAVKCTFWCEICPGTCSWYLVQEGSYIHGQQEKVGCFDIRGKRNLTENQEERMAYLWIGWTTIEKLLVRTQMFKFETCRLYTAHFLWMDVRVHRTRGREHALEWRTNTAAPHARSSRITTQPNIISWIEKEISPS